MYRATRSRIFSTRSGSGDTLKSSSRHGLSPNARQISPTVVCEIPCLAARPESTSASASGRCGLEGLDHDRLDPRRRRSCAPRRAGRVHQPVETVDAKRCRHFDTVTGLQPSSAAISAWVRSPSAQASTIRQRNANACDERCRRAQRCSVLRSSPLKVISTVGRPRRAMVSLRFVARPADQHVVAGTAGEDVVAAPADEHVVAVSTVEGEQGRVGGQRRGIDDVVAAGARRPSGGRCRRWRRSATSGPAGRSPGRWVLPVTATTSSPLVALTMTLSAGAVVSATRGGEVRRARW